MQAREQAMSHHAKHNKVQASDEEIDGDNASSGSNVTHQECIRSDLTAVVVISTQIAADLTDTH